MAMPLTPRSLPAEEDRCQSRFELHKICSLQTATLQYGERCRANDSRPIRLTCHTWKQLQCVNAARAARQTSLAAERANSLLELQKSLDSQKPLLDATQSFECCDLTASNKGSFSTSQQAAQRNVAEYARSIDVAAAGGLTVYVSSVKAP